MVESETPPQASTPIAPDDTEVVSRRASPGHEEVQEAVKTVLEGNTSAAEDMGWPTPMETEDRCRDQFGPQPNTIPETRTIPQSGERPPLKEGGASTPPVNSINQETLDCLVEAQCTLMGVVVEKI